MIIAVIVTSDETADGIQLASLFEKSHAEFNYIVNDSVYSSRENLVSIAPFNPWVFSALSNRSLRVTYNKDVDRYFCCIAYMTFRNSRSGKKNVGASQRETHYFDIVLCKSYPLRKSCYKDGAKLKRQT
ncbi:hypothetical protein [Exiguobacterium sp. ERU656]|uniref:hypothetical protein n=1 Tax=Exiguobacterium sp. ERU656 TaxID=2751217 RepID=UPI001BE8D8BE|nr:hypothetical protein [Exiguobacterium sp. ERU656]